MSLIEAVILGLIQGLTEFIPVSSSGHLIIAEKLLGTSLGGLTFDVALHIGTLLALLIFFYKDITQLIKAIFIKSDQTKLAWLLALATLPAVISGVLLQDLAESKFRSVKLVAINLAVVGVVMLLIERYGSKKNALKNIDKTSMSQALAMGAAQAVAVIPGISRSGITISAGMFSGLSRAHAARFSFLLAIPITTGAILKVLLSESSWQTVSSEKTIFLAGILTSLLSGLVAIKFLLGFLSKHGLYVFAYYRLVLAALVLVFFN